jgi:hypothetical protein
MKTFVIHVATHFALRTLVGTFAHLHIGTFGAFSAIHVLFLGVCTFAIFALLAFACLLRCF